MALKWKDIIQRTANELNLSYDIVEKEIKMYENILKISIKLNTAPRYDFFLIGTIKHKEPIVKRKCDKSKDEYWCDLCDMIQENKEYERILKYAYMEQKKT